MKILNKIFAIISIVLLTSFLFVSCDDDEVNEDYLLVVPEFQNFNGSTVVFINETATYSVSASRGGSEYVWTVEGAEYQTVADKPWEIEVTFNQADNLAKITVFEKAANGAESETSMKEIKVFGAPCDWTLDMQDDYGDGWNGASVSMTFDGYPAGEYTITADQGASNTETIAVPDNSVVEVTFNTGDWDSEVTYQLYNTTDAVFGDGPTPVVGVVYQATNECPE